MLNVLTLYAPISQDGQIHPNNLSSVFCPTDWNLWFYLINLAPEPSTRSFHRRNFEILTVSCLGSREIKLIYIKLKLCSTKTESYKLDNHLKTTNTLMEWNICRLLYISKTRNLPTEKRLLFSKVTHLIN